MSNNILKLKLKRIDPVKYATIAAFLTALIMLVIFVPFMLIFSALGLGAASDDFGAGAAIFGSGIFMIIFVPIIYGVLVFIITLISTMLMNFVLKKTGGLDIDFEKAGLAVENQNIDFTSSSQERIEN